MLNRHVIALAMRLIAAIGVAPCGSAEATAYTVVGVIS